ncbi:MAG: GTPase ObgE [Candidatus Hydrogenedens sp.]|nr:GTPase ObgE [Candidatus Hydrogenedens sp.]
MFVDRVRVKLTAGGGGNGCRSFRREKYVPFGGPDGGDGGNGGDVVLRADRQLTSLLDARYRSHIVGTRGVHGKGKDMHGKCSEPTIVRVPCGTVVKDFETGEEVADLTEDGQEFIGARGGKGGRGNARFVSANNRLPNFAEKGEPGEEVEYTLELKLIADVGIVGMPNAGKSTLTAKISEATPKIGAYPFTTLTPNLAVVPLPGFRSLTIADIPGIIEGAAEGKGLGHQFLRHIERTRVLLFLIDLGDEDPAGTRDILLNELRQYSDAFDEKPHVFALNKADLPENRERFEEFKKRFEHVYCISGATGEGVIDLIEQLWQLVDKVRKAEEGKVIIEPDKVYTFEPPYNIFKERGEYHIEGKRVLRAVRMTDFENEEAVRHLQDTFRHMGIFEALRRLGAVPGDTIVIGGVEMEYTPE